MNIFYKLAEKSIQLRKAGKSIIALNIGEGNLPVHDSVKEALINSLKSEQYGYVSAGGIPELREAIAKREKCSADNVIVGPGSKHLLFGLISILGNKNRKVFIPSPHYPAYELICRHIGLTPNFIKTTMEKRWTFDKINFENAGIMILCNPLNPTSTVYPEELLRKTLSEAKEKHIYVIIDEAYKGLSFKEIPQYPAILLKSFSKEFNMGGWRLGYVIAPEDIIKKLIDFNLITTTCVPEFIQRAGIVCIEKEKEIIATNREVWRKRLQIAEKSLKDAGFGFITPDAGIYIFTTHEKITDADTFALDLLDSGVAVAPGSSFGGYDNFIRICLNQPEDILFHAIEKIRIFLNKK